LKRIGLGICLAILLLAGTFVYVQVMGGTQVADNKTSAEQQQKRGSAQALGKMDPYAPTDGKVVKKQRIQVDSPYKNQTELYRIEYISEGVRVVGYLCKPKRINHKLPVIIFNRGGVVDSSQISEQTLQYFTKLSAHQYVVVASQYRGYGGSEGERDIGGKDVQDVLNLIPLAERLPYVDPEKKVMLGFSRGGMMTYIALKKGADVKAAAIVGGVSDLRRLYQDQEEFRQPLSHWVGDPLMDEKKFDNRSAVKWPEQIHVPVLMIHGLNDRTVLPEHSIRLAEEFEKLGHEHKLVLIPGGSHYLNNREQQRDQAIFEWFDHYLN
jgi:dipeptidyl aminopeptidase/acylaminoacyl peptidase